MSEQSTYVQKKLKDLVRSDRKIRYGIVQPGEYDEEGSFLIRGKDYSKGWADPKEFFKVGSEVVAKYKRAKVKPGDILLTIVGAGTGNVAIVPDWLDEANITQTTARIAVDQTRADPIYIYYYLASQFGKRLVYRFIKGGAQPGLNIRDVEIFKLSLPPLPEQRKIAEILSTWDEAIRKTEELIELKEKLKKRVMQQLLTGKKRLPGFEGEWEKVNVEDVFEVTRGKVLPVSNMTQEQSKEFCFPVYSSQTKNYGLTGFYNDYLFEDAITWTTDGANAGTVSFREGKFYCTNVCGVLLSKKGLANECMASILNSVAFKYVSHVGNPKLMNNVMANISIPLPTLEEQKKISEVLKLANDEIKLLHRKKEILQNQKKGLMQQLLTGKTRVNPKK